ncbi:MAG: cytochrome P450 [Mycobacterium sp.]|nr:cytochrome P450 [Mycobacterium sp.]
MTAATVTIGTPPGRRPLVGHALKMRKDGFAVMDSAIGCGDIAVLWLGPKPAYVVSHPELIRQLLTAEDRHLDKGPLYENLAGLIGESIGTLIGGQHRRRRRIVTPAYKPDPTIMADAANNLVSSWQPGRVYDLAAEMRRYSFMVMARTLFTDAITAEDEFEFVTLLPVALAGIAKFVADPTGLLKRVPTPDNRRINRALRRLKHIIERAVDRYRSGSASSGGILAALIDARDPQTGQPLTTEQIRNEAMVLMSAGSETVAGALAFVCRTMAYDTHVAARLAAEADGVIESLPMSGTGISDLQFTRRVITEVLRLYPPGALMSRRALVDIDLGGHHIPAGAALFFCAYLLHRRPDLYSEPTRFDPDRWLPERAAELPHGAFMPFGAGAHICIGEQIAWQETVIATATIAKRWRLTPVLGQTPRPVLLPTLNLDALNVMVEAKNVEACNDN